MDAALLIEQEMTGITNHGAVLVGIDDELRASRIHERAVQAGQSLSHDQILAQVRSQSATQSQRAQLLATIERERYGFLTHFDNTNPDDTQFDGLFWEMISRIDVF